MQSFICTNSVSCRKSCYLQDWVAKDVDFPRGSQAPRQCAKLYYIALNTYNAAVICCAANYLGITNAMERKTMVHKNKKFFTSILFQNWKSLIIILQAAKTFLPCFNNPRIAGKCTYSIASKVSIDPPKIDWFFIIQG